jgi:ribulose bisphosphate carboxylase small subunit
MFDDSLPANEPPPKKPRKPMKKRRKQAIKLLGPVPKKRRKRRVLKTAVEKPNGQDTRISPLVYDTIYRLVGMSMSDRNHVLNILKGLCA